MYIKQNVHCIFPHDKKIKKKKKKTKNKKMHSIYPQLQPLGRQLQTNNFLRMSSFRHKCMFIMHAYSKYEHLDLI